MGKTATTTTESTVEQTRKKYPVRRRATAQVAEVATRIIAAENDAPQRTRGALGKRLRQYGYGIYTDERTRMTILNPERTSEVLLSQGGPTQESRAQPKKSAPKKKKTSGTSAKQPSKKNSAPVPSQPTIGSSSDDMDQHMTRGRTKIAAVKNKDKENEVIESPTKEPTRPVRKSARIMNQFKAPRGKGDQGVVNID